MPLNKSFIRWAGAKSWLVPDVQNMLKGLDINNYHEPFMGGASIFFSLNLQRESYLSDVNAELVNAFVCVKENCDSVIEILKTWDTDEESYYKIRASESSDLITQAARFLYLNANSYNGLYRVNRSGHYNVPYGKRNIEVDYERLKRASQQLTSTIIKCQDFRESLIYIRPKDFVFLDPPYTVSKDKNGFIAYNQNLFSLDDQRRLCEFVGELNRIGAYYVLTNAAHETIEQIFQDVGIKKEMERNSLIGGRNSFRGKIKEFIFTNIPERR